MRPLPSLAGSRRSRIAAVSAWRETAPIGGPPGQARFLNGALRAETSLGPHELLDLPAADREPLGPAARGAMGTADHRPRSAALRRAGARHAVAGAAAPAHGVAAIRARAGGRGGRRDAPPDDPLDDCPAAGTSEHRPTATWPSPGRSPPARRNWPSGWRPRSPRG